MQLPPLPLSPWSSLEPPAASAVAKILLTAAVASLLAKIGTMFHRKVRIARGLEPLSGSPGVWLLGNMPAFIKNHNRIYEFLVRN